MLLLVLLGGAVAWQFSRRVPAEPQRSLLRLHENVMTALQDGEIVRTTEVLDPGTPRGQAQTQEANRRLGADSNGMLSQPLFDPPLAWLVGERPGFHLDVVEPVDRDLLLQIANGMTEGEQRLTVLFNGHALDSVTLPPAPAPPEQPAAVMVRLAVPAGLQVRGSNRVELRFDHVQMRQLRDEPELPLAAILTHVRFAPSGHLDDPPAPVPTAGLVTETSGSQPRAALVLPPGTVARVPLQLPAAPRVVLRFVPEQVGAPVEVSLYTDTGQPMPLDRLVPDDRLPAELRYDLTPWAGQAVLIEFWAQDAGKTPASPKAPGQAPGETRLVEAHVLVPGDWNADASPGAEAAPAASVAAPPAPTSPDHRPSFLVITLDALARADAEAQVQGAPVMPNLAAVMARGVVCSQATAPASYTLASVGSLLTGQGPLTHGVTLLHDESGQLQLRPGAPRLAAALGEQGWRTAAFMTNPNTARDHGYGEGFELYDELFSDPKLWRENEGVAGSNLPARLEKFLAQGAGQPFLAWVHVFEPHAPYDAPPDLQSRYVPPYAGDVSGQRSWIDAARISRKLPDAAGLEHLHALYTARTALADRVLGDLLAVLERSGRAADTVIVVLSDHGEAFGQHGALEHGDDVHQEQVDVPLVFVVPGRNPERRAGPASLVDVAPTLLALAGLPAAAGMEGTDLLGGPLDAQRPLLSRNADRLPTLGWTRGNLRLIADLATRRVELYDTERDPHEAANLADGRPVTAALLFRELCHAVCAAEAAAGAPVPVVAANPDLDPKLTELGYVGNAGSGAGTGAAGGAPAASAGPPRLGALMRSMLTRL